MRKQELIHLHGLCIEVRSRFEERHDLPADAFERYDGMDVPPTAIHRRKEAHREAVACLLDDLDEICTSSVREPPSGIDSRR